MLAAVVASHGQEITLGVLTPGNEQNLTSSQSALLQSRLESLCTRNGIAVAADPNGFFLYPQIAILSHEVDESGMQNVHAIKIELSLSVRQVEGDAVANTTQTYSGGGLSLEKAITSALQSFSISTPKYQQFIQQAQSSILNYYQRHCTQIIAQAEQAAILHNYRQAIALLAYLPSSLPCAASVNSQLSSYYQAYQSSLCSRVEMEVESAMATHNYTTAAALLTEIDPSSECYPYAVECFKKIETAVKKLEQRDWNFKMKQYNDAIALEKRTLQAATEVAKAYYASQPTVHYTQIIH